MSAAPRIAVMFDPDQLGFREQATLRGIAGYAQRAGWQLVLDPYAVHHPSGRYEGILACPRGLAMRPIRRSSVPVVCISWAQKTAGLICTFENRYAAGRLAARHLVERGYRTFGYLGFSRNTQSFWERREFARVLHRLGRHVRSALILRTYSDKAGRMDDITRWTDAWLGRLETPVGIFVARPGLARVLAQLALARGLRIPEDIGLIAADDDPVLGGLPPALTSIRFDYEDLGHRAAELLDRLMHGQPKSRRAILIEPTLVPRASTDREALADPLVSRALRFIDDRRTEAIGPREVAAGLGVPARTLQRRLRAAGRGTIQQEIAKARVEHAKLLLEDLARSRVRAQRRRPRSPVNVVFDGPPADPYGDGWREWRGDPRRRAALVERLPDGTERIRRRPLPMPDTPPGPRGRPGLAVVARQAGFGSVAALDRAFRRHEGVSPWAWKRSRQPRIARMGTEGEPG